MKYTTVKGFEQFLLQIYLHTVLHVSNLVCSTSDTIQLLAKLVQQAVQLQRDRSFTLDDSEVEQNMNIKRNWRSKQKYSQIVYQFNVG